MPTTVASTTSTTGTGSTTSSTTTGSGGAGGAGTGGSGGEGGIFVGTGGAGSQTPVRALPGLDSITFYERTGGDTPTYALIVLNTNQVHDSRTSFENVAMQVSAPKGAVLVDVLGSKQQYTVAGDGTLDLTLAPVTGLLLVPQQDVK